MVSQREIKFWQKFAAQGSLASGVRNYRERAHEFFGALASMRANEDELNLILKTQITATSTTEEILAELKGICKEKLSAAAGQSDVTNGTIVSYGQGLAQGVTQKEMEDMASSHCTPEFAAGVKKSAEHYLRTLHG
jgi:hypothetical protein